MSIIEEVVKDDKTVTWSLEKRKYIKTPIEIIEFLKDIEDVCKKHNLTISHEDGHGAFIIEEFDRRTLRWLANAQDGR